MTGFDFLNINIPFILAIVIVSSCSVELNIEQVL